MWFCIVRLHECLPFFSHMGLFWNVCPFVLLSHSIKLILKLEDLSRSNKTIFKNGNDILDVYSKSLTIIHVTLFNCIVGKPTEINIQCIYCFPVTTKSWITIKTSAAWAKSCSFPAYLQYNQGNKNILHLHGWFVVLHYCELPKMNFWLQTDRRKQLKSSNIIQSKPYKA